MNVHPSKLADHVTHGAARGKRARIEINKKFFWGMRVGSTKVLLSTYSHKIDESKGHGGRSFPCATTNAT